MSVEKDVERLVTGIKRGIADETIEQMRERHMGPPTGPKPGNSERDTEREVQGTRQYLQQKTEREIENSIKRSGVPVGNSADLNKVREVLNNGVTHAHDDACKAVDKVVADARALMGRLEKAAEEHNKLLCDKGQEIAQQIESAMNRLTTTVEWIEERTKELKPPEK